MQLLLSVLQVEAQQEQLCLFAFVLMKSCAKTRQQCVFVCVRVSESVRAPIEAGFLFLFYYRVNTDSLSHPFVSV